MRVYLETNDKKLTLNGPASLFALPNQNYSAGFTIDLSAPEAYADLSALSPSVASKISLKLPAASTSYDFKPDEKTGTVAVRKNGYTVATLPVLADSNTSSIEFSDRAATVKVTTAADGTPFGILAAIADTLAPELLSAVVDNTTLILNYSDINSIKSSALPPASAFTVLGGSDGKVVNPVTAVSIASKSVILTLTNSVSADQKVSVSYTQPAQNPIQDDVGNRALSFSAKSVSFDTTPPVFSSASVVDKRLEIKYTEANLLGSAMAPANAFTVINSDQVNPVSAVSVDTSAKKVVLTLTNSVLADQPVTVSYLDPTSGNDANAVQDSAGNDAASFLNQSVVNNTSVDETPPLLTSAVVIGNTLTLSYSDTNLLNALAPVTAFAITVDNVQTKIVASSIDPVAKTVLLTLEKAVTFKQSVSVAYTDPTASNDASALQDIAGNDALSFSALSVTNNTPDSVAPVLVTSGSAKVEGNLLTLTFDDKDSLNEMLTAPVTAFSVKTGATAATAIVDNPVTKLIVSPANKTVTLVLTNSVINNNLAVVTYTDPTVGNDTAALQDVSGNDVATFTVTSAVSTTVDKIAPVFSSASVNANILAISYTELNALSPITAPMSAYEVKSGAASATTLTANPVTGISVDQTSNKVILTLANAVTSTDKLSLAYTDPSTADDVYAIQDWSGNDAITFAAKSTATAADKFTNDTPAVVTVATDSTAPVLASATINQNSLVLSYTEANLLSSTTIATTAFTVSKTPSGGQSSTVTVSNVAIDPSAKKITLLLSSPVLSTDTVTIAVPAATVKDTSGNGAIALTAQSVTNISQTDVTAPTLSTAIVADNTITLTFNEPLNTATSGFATVGNYTVKVNGTTYPVSAISSTNASATNSTILTLSSPVPYGSSVSLSFASTLIADPSGNTLINNAPNGILLSNTTAAKTGKLTTPIGTDDEAHGVYVQSDGKILVSGSSDGNFALVRYTNVGTLDTSFNSTGKVSTSFGATEMGRAMAVQSDGKVVIAGYMQDAISQDFSVVRYTSAGVLDTSSASSNIPFNSTNGYVKTDVNSSSDIGNAVAIDTSGNIIVAGTASNDFAVVRYTSAGALDTTFDTDGKMTTDIGSSTTDNANAVTVQADGKIVVAGTSANNFAVVRYTTAGALDTTFDTDGKLTSDIGSSTTDAANAVAIQNDGKIVVAGTSANDFAVVRYTSDGALDSTFGTAGKKTTDIGSSTNDVITCMVIQPDGKILVGGYSDTDFAMARYNYDGSLDTTFGATGSKTGKVTTDIGTSTTDVAYGITLQSDGKIVLTGVSNGDFAVVRYAATGELDTTFGA
jgi:uncharacterized delta-60 repeat protein/uncharacterized repeat protein (TIGR02059 family)